MTKAAELRTPLAQKKLIDRAARIRGQLEAVEGALRDQKGSFEILQTLAAARGAMNGLVAELIEEHVRSRVLDRSRKPTAERARATEELIDVVRAYVK